MYLHFMNGLVFGLHSVECMYCDCIWLLPFWAVFPSNVFVGYCLRYGFVYPCFIYRSLSVTWSSMAPVLHYFVCIVTSHRLRLLEVLLGMWLLLKLRNNPLHFSRTWNPPTTTLYCTSTITSIIRHESQWRCYEPVLQHIVPERVNMTWAVLLHGSETVPDLHFPRLPEKQNCHHGEHRKFCKHVLEIIVGLVIVWHVNCHVAKTMGVTCFTYIDRVSRYILHYMGLAYMFFMIKTTSELFFSYVQLVHRDVLVPLY
jgi:hypothetical protein